MDPTQLVITILGLAVIGGGTVAYRAFLKHQSEDKKVDAETQARVQMSVQETKRMEILADALTAQPALRHIKGDFEDAQRTALRGVGDAKTVEINGVELPRAAAQQIASTPRSRSEDVQLNGNYTILKIDWQDKDDIRLTIESRDDNGTFVASLGQEIIRPEHREMLKSAEWDRKPIYMSINASKLRGEVTTARIIGVSWPDPKKS